MVDLLEAVQLAILTLIIGLVVGYELGRICERLVRASARSRRMNDDAAEAPATTTPRAESVKRPFAESDDNSGGNRTDNGDDDGFHAAILPQKQEAGK